MPMFCDSFLSWKKQNSSSCSIEQSSNNTYTSFGLTVAATAGICLLSSHRAVATISFDSHLDLPERADLHADSQHDRSTGFLPQILGLLPISIQAQIVSWFPEIADTEHHQHSHSHGGMGGNSLQDLTPLYLSQGLSTSTKQFAGVKIKRIDSSFTSHSNLLSAKPQKKLQTYTVKAGDTLNSIAREHKVSRDEIIKLNKIKNSNVIFVSQQLQLPTIERDAIAQTIKSPQINATAANIPQKSTIKTNLRSSVSSRRVNQIEDREHEIATNSSKRANLEQKRLTQLNEDLKRIPAENNQNSAFRNKPAISSIVPESDRENESISAATVSLQLPPLPSSEEYLPKTFDGYIWPAKGVLTSGYGWRWGKLHKGIDIAGPVGTPVFAAASGEVISAGWNSGGYGNLIKLRHLDGSMTLYAHNNKILVNSGEKVAQGDQIAEMGNTGFSTGSHLHFEIHSREQGIINPLALLK